jgi:NADP-reducing hydrogenase subunit HndB
MPKLRIEDLERIVESQKKATSLREGAGRAKITVHMGTCGISAGARKIMAEIMRCIQEAGVNDVLVTTSGCAGLCSREPMVTVEVLGQAPVKYVDLNEKKVRTVFEQHVLKGDIVSDFALALGSERMP